MPPIPKSMYLVKYEYESKIGCGICFVRANDSNEAVRIFRFKMFAKRDPLWMEQTYRQTDFQFISRTKTGWILYQNVIGTAMLKIMCIDDLPDIAWISEHFESFD